MGRFAILRREGYFEVFLAEQQDALHLRIAFGDPQALCRSRQFAKYLVLIGRRPKRHVYLRYRVLLSEPSPTRCPAAIFSGLR